MNYKTQLKYVKLFAFDYDGVFTDGMMFLMPDGSQVRNANVKDGFAVQWAIKQGLAWWPCCCVQHHSFCHWCSQGRRRGPSINEG